MRHTLAHTAAKLHKPTTNGLTVDKGIETNAQLRPSSNFAAQLPKVNTMYTIHKTTNGIGDTIGWCILKDKMSVVKDFDTVEEACAYCLALEDGEAKPVALKNVKAGDYIKRKADSKAVYIKGAYDRVTKSFSCIDVEDICREIFIKADKAVFVGFTY